MFHALLNLLFPPTCLACKEILAYGEKHLCIECLATLPSAELDLKPIQDKVFQKFRGDIPVTHIFSCYYFTKKGRVQQLIHNLKYTSQPDALEQLGRHLAHYIKKENPPLDLLIPVPLHTARYAKRGYNQSTLLAKGMSQVLSIPVEEVLRRDHYTETQTGKGRLDRWQNMKSAFSLLEPEKIMNRHILLIDDVITTGATITACGEQLLASPIASLSIATLAVAY